MKRVTWMLAIVLIAGNILVPRLAVVLGDREAVELSEALRHGDSDALPSRYRNDLIAAYAPYAWPKNGSGN